MCESRYNEKLSPYFTDPFPAAPRGTNGNVWKEAEIYFFGQRVICWATMNPWETKAGNLQYSRATLLAFLYSISSFLKINVQFFVKDQSQGLKITTKVSFNIASEAKWSINTNFWKQPEVCGQKDKIGENVRIQKFNCDTFINFQTMCKRITIFASDNSGATFPFLARKFKC